MSVAPYTGAWIEIAFVTFTYDDEHVAPYTGAWIEIGLANVSGLTDPVAPYTGAWIEICRIRQIALSVQSRSLYRSVD